MEKAQLLYLQNRVAYARDQLAYKELYLYFHPAVYKVAPLLLHKKFGRRNCVGRDDPYVDDGKKLAYVEHLKSYLLVAAKNTALTYLKNTKKTVTLKLARHVRSQNCQTCRTSK